jgi:hypothetical protein
MSTSITKTRLKRIFIRILSISGLLVICGLFYFIYFFVFPITFLDRPYFLSDKRETIEVSYIMWGCDCSDFIETRNYKNNPVSEAKDDDLIFIEAADSSLIVPRDFYVNGRYTKKLRLTGQFYRKKGISRTYEMKTPQKPEWARVFRYDKMEIVDSF